MLLYNISYVVILALITLVLTLEAKMPSAYMMTENRKCAKAVFSTFYSGP